jgi:hypothetical protein
LQDFDAANCRCVCRDPSTFGCGPFCCDGATESCQGGTTCVPR